MFVWLGIMAALVCLVVMLFTLERTDGHPIAMRAAIVLVSPFSFVLVVIGLATTIVGMFVLSAFPIGVGGDRT